MERDATKIRGFGERETEKNSVREEAEETGIGEKEATETEETGKEIGNGETGKKGKEGQA